MLMLRKEKDIATRNKKQLGAPGIATRSKDASCTTRNKKLLVTSRDIGERDGSPDL